MRIGARPTRDHALVQIVDAALADATQRSGHWLACRPGCAQCCMGPFPINQLDAARLQNGLRNLEELAPERAARVRQRAHESVARLAAEFPGDPDTGLLNDLRALPMMSLVRRSIPKREPASFMRRVP